jgi:hypothetical protein
VNDLEEMMLMEAMRLSMLEHEEQQKREAEAKRKAEQQQGSAGEVGSRRWDVNLSLRLHADCKTRPNLVSSPWPTPLDSSSRVQLPIRHHRPRRCGTLDRYRVHNPDLLRWGTYHIPEVSSPNPPKAVRSVGPRSPDPRSTSVNRNGPISSTSIRMPLSIRLHTGGTKDGLCNIYTGLLIETRSFPPISPFLFLPSRPAIWSSTNSVYKSKVLRDRSFGS